MWNYKMYFKLSTKYVYYTSYDSENEQKCQSFNPFLSLIDPPLNWWNEAHDLYKLYAVFLVQFFPSLFDQQTFCEIRKLWVMENYPAVNVFCELWPFGTYDPDKHNELFCASGVGIALALLKQCLLCIQSFGLLYSRVKIKETSFEQEAVSAVATEDTWIENLYLTFFVPYWF